MATGATGVTWKREFPGINYEISLESNAGLTATIFSAASPFPVGE
jgi:hypothetical protein